MFLFMLGLLIGGCMGMLMMALCVIAKKGDDGNGEERKLTLFAKYLDTCFSLLRLRLGFRC